MEFKQLQSFVTVVKCGSFTTAADQLYTSQPTISAHIRQLEEELHFRLIIRTTKSLEVTPKGMELYDFASHVLFLRDDLMKRWTNENHNIIRLGTSTIPSSYILSELLLAFQTIDSETKFHIHQGTSETIIDGILHGTYEVGLVGTNGHADGITYVPFFDDSMVIVTPMAEKFLALKKEPVSPVETLMGEPLLLLDQSSGKSTYLEPFFKEYQLEESDLNVIARLNDQETIKQLVTNGFGISILSRKAALDFEQEDKLLTFPIPSGKSNHTLYLAYRTDFILKESTKQFISFTKQYYRQH